MRTALSDARAALERALVRYRAATPGSTWERVAARRVSAAVARVREVCGGRPE